MKRTLLFVMFLNAVCLFVHAQNNHLDSAISSSKTKAEDNIVNQANAKINAAINGLFTGKKKVKKQGNDQSAGSTPPDATPVITTTINIDQADYKMLSGWAKQLKGNTNVSLVELVFDDSVHSLQVTHKGTSDDVLNYLLDNSSGHLSVVKKRDNVIALKVQ